MSKLNKQYLTLGEFLTEAFARNKRRSGDTFDTSIQRLLRIRGVRLETQMKGSFQSAVDMKKDLVDTFKPYRSNWYAKRDAKQPLYGIYNFFKGIGYILASLLLLLAIPFYCIPQRNRGGQETYLLALIGYSAFSFSWFIDGILSAVRGATQLLTTLLTWFIKIPLRALITFFTPEKDLFIENRPAIQAALKKANEILRKGEDVNPTIHCMIDDNGELLAVKDTSLTETIRDKYVKGFRVRGEHTGFKDFERVHELFAKANTVDGVRNFLNFFAPALDSKNDQTKVSTSEKTFKHESKIGC